MRHVLVLRERQGYRALVPSLPECKAYGDTFQEAVANVRAAIGDYEAHLTKHGAPIPEERYNLAHVADDVTPPGMDDIRVFVSIAQPPMPAGEQWAIERLQEMKLIVHDR